VNREGDGRLQGRQETMQTGTFTLGLDWNDTTWVGLGWVGVTGEHIEGALRRVWCILASLVFRTRGRKEGGVPLKRVEDGEEPAHSG
jgi:hypothetical protein